MNVKVASEKIVGSQIKINSRQNLSIWVIFETDEENLENIPGQLDQKPNQDETEEKVEHHPQPKPIINEIENQVIDIKKEFLQSFFEMNEDFIYIEPKLIPIIPGEDPTVINKVSEFSEDNF